MQFQQDNLCKKNFPKNYPVRRESTRKGGEAQAPPAALETKIPSPAPAAPPAVMENFPPPENLNQEAKIDLDPLLLKTANRNPKTANWLLDTENRKPKTENPLVYDPWLSCDSGFCSPDPPPNSLETRNPEPATRNPEPKKAFPNPCFLERTADELFEISHGYKRSNPPEHIPNRRRDEDFRSSTIFGDIRNVLKHMLG